MRKVRSDKGAKHVIFSEEIYDDILERIEMVIRCLRYVKQRIIRVVAWYIEDRIGPRLCGALQGGGKTPRKFILDEILIIADDESKDHNNSGSIGLIVESRLDNGCFLSIQNDLRIIHDRMSNMKGRKECSQ